MINLMKKIGAIGLISSALSAEVFTGVNVSMVTSGNDKFFNGLENVSSVVGEGGQRLDLRAGMVSHKKDSTVSVFAYGWGHDASKNNEIGLGIGGKFGTQVFSKDNYISIGGRAGIGYQPTSGKSFMTSTNTTNVSYVTGSSTASPREATFTSDTYVFEIGLELGYTYVINNDFDLCVNAEYISSNYQFKYSIPEGNVNLSGVGQDNYLLGLGLNYKF